MPKSKPVDSTYARFVFAHLLVLLFVFSSAAGADGSLLSQVCAVSGEQGVAEFRLNLRGADGSAFDRWMSAVRSSPLDASARSPDFFHFCPKTDSCGLVANWYLSMHPDAKVRKEAVFLALNNMSWRLNGGVLRTWSEARKFLTRSFYVGDEDRTALVAFAAQIRTIGKSGSNAFKPEATRALCAYASEPLSCLRVIPQAYELVAPAYVTSEETGSPFDFFNLSLSVPEAFKHVFGDPRYARALADANTALLDEVAALELALKNGHPAPALPGLDAILDRSVKTEFSCSDSNCVRRRKNDILLLYGSRGSSFLGLTNYLRGAFLPALAEYGAFANLINYVEALERDVGASELLTFANPTAASCAHPKPYHLIFSRALVETLRARGASARGAAQAVYLLSLGYRLASESTLQIPPALRVNRLSSYYMIKRLDLVYDGIGAMQGEGKPYDADPAAVLSAMSGLSQNALWPAQQSYKIKSVSELESSGWRAQASDLYQDLSGRLKLFRELGGLAFMPLF